MKNNKMNLVERTLAPTPKWFKILRTVGIALASVGGIIIASPIIAADENATTVIMGAMAVRRP